MGGDNNLRINRTLRIAMSEVTIVFADLTGSTSIFESLGNARATAVVTRITQDIGRTGSQRGGRIIKFLGDAVLMAFVDNYAAVHAVIDMQRQHHERTKTGVLQTKLRIKIGMARGEIVEQGGDFFGDAVNVASRLSDLAGADEICATDNVIAQLPQGDVRYLKLGPMSLRGKSEPLPVYRIEWQPEESSEFLTVTLEHSALDALHAQSPHGMDLTWLDMHASFQSTDTPIFLGRGQDVQFAVNDPRVSRLHAKIDHRGEVFVLEDISSYGTWVRFAGSDKVVSLRRQECVLLEQGEIALGTSFDDISAPTVSFQLHAPSAH